MFIFFVDQYVKFTLMVSLGSTTKLQQPFFDYFDFYFVKCLFYTTSLINKQFEYNSLKCAIYNRSSYSVSQYQIDFKFFAIKL